MADAPAGSQLWAKGAALDPDIHRFTVGNDPQIDPALVPFDALGSAAHALTLHHGGYLGADDTRALVAALHAIAVAARAGDFRILPAQEDGHTAIEAGLVRAAGEAGKRIHLGRSRNDQVILATRLYLREELLELGRRAATLAERFAGLFRVHGAVPMPGYTHLRRAMPSSIGQWSGAFVEGLLEELEALQALYRRLDRCPAGAAAGFGAPVALDRDYTARLLGFARVQRSPVDVQNSRGRHELAVLRWLSELAAVLEKFLWDVALYSTDEFGFLVLPDAFTTGSSIMPHKRNPDVVELARGACRELRGEAALVEALGTGLPSNYHRDLQLLKAPLVRALARGRELLEVLARLVPALVPDAERLRAAQVPELWAAHEASRRALRGQGFRDAYRAVGEEIRSGSASLQAERTPPAPPLDAALAELAIQRAWLEERGAWHRRHERDIWNACGEPL